MDRHGLWSVEEWPMLKSPQHGDGLWLAFSDRLILLGDPVVQRRWLGLSFSDNGST